MSYQGTLTQNGVPVSDGLHQLRVTLYADAEGKQALWTDTYTTEVKNSIFTLQLGSAKALPAVKTIDRDLWVGVSVNGTDEMRPLTRLDAVPMALNIADQAVTLKKLGPDVIGMINKQGPQQHNGGALVDYWGEQGNSNLGTGFFGTTDAFNIPVKVNNNQLLLLMDGYGVNNYDACNILGGWGGNSINTNGVGNVIAGGGHKDNNPPSPVNHPNRIGNSTAAYFGFIGSGFDNQINNGNAAAIVAGITNSIVGNYSFIGGGRENSISAVSNGYSVITGGQENTADGDWASVLGGTINNADGDYSAVLGGRGLTLGDNSVGFLAKVTHDVSVGANIAYFGNVNMWLENTDETARQLRFYEASNGGGGNYTSFEATSQSANIAYVLPAAQGSAGSNLTNDGSGNLSWGPGLGNAWQLTGNTGTTVGTNFIGTTDDEEFEIRVFNNDLVANRGSKRVLRFEYNSESPNLLGGFQNNARSTGVKGATIGGGGKHNQINQVTDNFGFVGGGAENQAGNRTDGVTDAMFAVVVGGENNRAKDDHTFIGGGNDNEISLGQFSAIVAGQSNTVNTSSPAWSIIGAGDLNEITVNGRRSMIGAGSGNSISGENNFIGAGGAFNQQPPAGNTIDGDGSFIGAGQNNTISGLSNNAFIGSGTNNRVQQNTGVIVGGDDNLISRELSFIGGGKGHRIQSSGSMVTIPGGDHLIAHSYAQTVIGAFNKDQGASGTTNFRTQDPDNRLPASPPTNWTFSDNRIFIVGNGHIPHLGDEEDVIRSNAFEVTSGGYSIVYGNLNAIELVPNVVAPVVTSTNPTKAVVHGGVYQDNIIYAWGDVPPGSTPAFAAKSSFGVASITFVAPNVYTITLNTIASTTDVNTSPDLTQASITATPSVDFHPTEAPSICNSIIVSRLSAGSPQQFKVFTFSTLGSNCTPSDDVGFMFKVTGRR